MCAELDLERGTEEADFTPEMGGRGRPLESTDPFPGLSFVWFALMRLGGLGEGVLEEEPALGLEGGVSNAGDEGDLGREARLSGEEGGAPVDEDW